MSEVRTEVAEEDSVCEKVVESLAEAEETEPTELDPPLYEVIDSDALERLFAKERALGKVVFNYDGYEVRVFSDGFVSVDPRDA